MSGTGTTYLTTQPGFHHACVSATTKVSDGSQPSLTFAIHPEPNGWLPSAEPPGSPRHCAESPRSPFPNKVSRVSTDAVRYFAPSLASDLDFHFANATRAYPPTLSLRSAALLSAGMTVSE